jgi:hypothetical protein
MQRTARCPAQHTASQITTNKTNTKQSPAYSSQKLTGAPHQTEKHLNDNYLQQHLEQQPAT